MAEKLESKTHLIQPGMAVEATRGDLGEEDVSKPKVESVIRDQNGQVQHIVIKKGALFQKELVIPVDRVQRVVLSPHEDIPGTVFIDGREKELEALNAIGEEELVSEAEIQQQEQEDEGLLSEVEKTLPTAEGLREKELDNVVHGQQAPAHTWHSRLPSWLQIVGPGFIAGMAGNDSSAVASYAIDGAQSGYGHLWLMLLSTPLYHAVQYTCAKVGRVTQQGLAEVLREHYGRWVAIVAALTLVIANIALIAADLVAVSSGLGLLTHLNWLWFVVPVAALLWYLTVYRNFEALKKIFVVLSLAFVTYIITAIIAKPAWGTILFNTFVPHVDLTFASISSAVALLGATISPYNIYWQVQGEKEEKRPGSPRQQLTSAALDIGVGVVSGNAVAYFIIVSTAATLFTHHKSINTAQDAAQALVPVLGPFAEYLFALGLIGAGLVAIPVLLASTSYAVAGTFGWPVGLSKKPWQNEGFYLILSVALLLSLALALLHLDPIKLIFWANILSGVLAPILVVYLLIIANNRRIMQGQRLSWLTNAGLVLTVVVMVAATILLFYGLATGQAGS